MYQVYNLLSFSLILFILLNALRSREGRLVSLVNEEVPIGKYQSIVFIQNENSSLTNICTGALIHERYVLTTRNCLENKLFSSDSEVKSLKITGGDNHYSPKKQSYFTRQTVNAEEIILPEFHDESSERAAVIRLSRNVMETSYFFQTSLSKMAPSTFSVCSVVGFSSDDENKDSFNTGALLEGDVILVPLELCGLSEDLSREAETCAESLEEIYNKTTMITSGLLFCEDELVGISACASNYLISNTPCRYILFTYRQDWIVDLLVSEYKTRDMKRALNLRVAPKKNCATADHKISILFILFGSIIKHSYLANFMRR